MKKTNTCPKCGGTDITIASTPSAFMGEGLPSVSAEVIYVDRYVCSDCGYMEYWLGNPLKFKNSGAKSYWDSRRKEFDEKRARREAREREEREIQEYWNQKAREQREQKERDRSAGPKRREDPWN